MRRQVKHLGSANKAVRKGAAVTARDSQASYAGCDDVLFIKATLSGLDRGFNLRGEDQGFIFWHVVKNQLSSITGMDTNKPVAWL